MEKEWGCSYWQMGTWDERIRQMYRSKDFADIAFVVENDGESISFPANKLILAMSSPMFEETFKNPRSAATNRIVVHNIQPEIVEIMLDHIYNQTKVDFTSLNQCFNVLKLATQYELSALRRICTVYIEQFINVTHVCSVYETAVSVSDKNLALKCLQLIQMETKDILKQDSWNSALPVTVEAIVKQEYLNISEEELFEAIIRWAEWQAKTSGMLTEPGVLRRLVEPFLPHIRFFHMSVDSFLKIAGATVIFNYDEIGVISLSLHKKVSCPLPSWFNHNTNHRSYECRKTVNDVFRNDWFNVNQEVYFHSEPVKSISCNFKARSNEFMIHQLHIGICDDCLAVNRNRKESLILKVVIEVDTSVQERVITLPIERSPEVERPALNFNKNEILQSVRSFNTASSLHSIPCVSWEEQPPIVQAVIYPLYPDMCHLKETPLPQTLRFPKKLPAPSILAEPLNFTLDQPLTIQSEQRFKIYIETENKEHFFCCKKKPSFEGAPFAGCKMDGAPEVWCALEKIRYSVSRFHSELYD